MHKQIFNAGICSVADRDCYRESISESAFSGANKKAIAVYKELPFSARELKDKQSSHHYWALVLHFKTEVSMKCYIKLIKKEMQSKLWLSQENMLFLTFGNHLYVIIHTNSDAKYMKYDDVERVRMRAFSVKIWWREQRTKFAHYDADKYEGLFYTNNNSANDSDSDLSDDEYDEPTHDIVVDDKGTLIKRNEIKWANEVVADVMAFDANTDEYDDNHGDETSYVEAFERSISDVVDGLVNINYNGNTCFPGPECDNETILCVHGTDDLHILRHFKSMPVLKNYLTHIVGGDEKYPNSYKIIGQFKDYETLYSSRILVSLNIFNIIDKNHLGDITQGKCTHDDLSFEHDDKNACGETMYGQLYKHMNSITRAGCMHTDFVKEFDKPEHNAIYNALTSAAKRHNNDVECSMKIDPTINGMEFKIKTPEGNNIIIPHNIMYKIIE